MFKHIVMWRFIDGAAGKSKKEHALWAKKELEALVGVIPEISSLEVPSQSIIVESNKVLISP